MRKRAKSGNGGGSVYKRSDGRWVGAITIGAVGGKQVRRVVYGDTQRAVLDKITRIREEHRQHLPVAVDKQAVGEFLDAWLENIARMRLRPSTWEGYAEIIKLHLKPSIGKTKLTDLAVEQCDVLWRQKIDAGLSPRRVQYIRAVLRVALQSAVKKGRIARNVAALSDSPKCERAEIVPLTIEETKRLIKAIKGHRFEVPFLFSLLLGLRRGEVLGLTWPHVDVEGRSVTIRRQLQRLKRKDIEGRFSMRDVIWLDDENALVPLKTKKSQRMLDLPPLLIDKLKTHKSSQAAKQLAAGPKWKDAHAMVFTGADGSPVTGQMMTAAWDDVLVAAKLPKKRLHDARHGAGTALLDLGVDLKVISAFLGHSTIQMTADTYLHTRRAVLGDAVAKLDALYK